MTDLQTKCLAVGVRLEYATKRHACAMGRIARRDDRVEIMASGKFLPDQAVRASINRSDEAWAAYVVGRDGRRDEDSLLGVFGIVDYKNGWSAPWAVTSIHVDFHRLTYWRASKVVIEHFRSHYPQMVQMIHARYSGALRWAERLGFTLRGPEPFGWENALFCRIEMRTPKLIVGVETGHRTGGVHLHV